MRLGIWRLAFLGAFAVTTVAAVGCSSVDMGETEDELTLESGRSKNNVLTDNELLGIGQNTVVPTQQQIQKFLEKTSHGGGTRSILADKKIQVDLGDGTADVRVSEAIYNAAKVAGINPLALLVRLQLEQSLVGTTPGQITETELDRRLSIAFGCGCPHAPVCRTEPEKYTGFYQQASCAVRTIKGHFDSARSRGQTSTGWGPGIAKTTQDGSEVTPENIATAVLYTYTPYAGKDYEGEPSTACKNKTGQADYCAGNALHTYLWDSYATAIGGKTSAGRDGGVDASIDEDEDDDASTVTPTPTTEPTGTGTTPPPDPPPQTGECSGDGDCSSNGRGHACLLDYTCGCFTDTDCPSDKPTCDPATSTCKASAPNPYPTTNPTSTGTSPYPGTPGTPRPKDAGTFPLYDAGTTYDPTVAGTTPPATAPRPADDPSTRPAAGSTDIGYSTNNPYGENTSYTDGGKSKKKKKNAAKDAGGCAVNAAGSPTELPSSVFLALGVTAILAARRRKENG